MQKLAQTSQTQVDLYSLEISHNYVISVQKASLTLGLFPVSTTSFHLFLLPVPYYLFLFITAAAAFIAALAAGMLSFTCSPAHAHSPILNNKSLNNT